MRWIALVALLAPAVALANGRAPVTNGVRFRPGDDRSLYVASTFGLLVSHDDGCSFRWICEQNLGYAGMFDPKYRIAADGTLFATTFTGLRVSRDGGCTFTTATSERASGDPGRIADRWIDALDIGPTGEVWVATADSGKPNDIYRSTDNGVTFEARGMLSQTIWWKSLAIARSRPQRIYATGYEVAVVPPVTHFRISDNSGQDWTASPLAGVQFGSTPLVYVLGVDRTNPDIVFMSSAGANPPTGDKLYRSTDGGVTWAEVLAPPAPIVDLAIGERGVVVVATLGGGAFQSSDGGAAFSAMTEAPQLTCVGQRDDGALYGCGANWQPDFKAVAKSADGASWDKVFRFVELAGPLECAPGTPQHDLCDSQWPMLKEQFGATGPTTCAPEPDATPVRRAGCCEANGAEGGIAAIALAALCGATVLRRRRAGQGSSASSALRQLG